MSIPLPPSLSDLLGGVQEYQPYSMRTCRRKVSGRTITLEWNFPSVPLPTSVGPQGLVLYIVFQLSQG